MDIHKNARLTPHSRAVLVPRVLQQGETAKAVRKWVARFQDEGPDGLRNRSSRPHKLRQPTPQATREMIVDPRRQRFAGQQIARDTGVSPATVSRVLRRAGHRVTGDRRGQSNRRGTKLGGMGWAYVHVCIDDASRVALNRMEAPGCSSRLTTT